MKRLNNKIQTITKKEEYIYDEIKELVESSTISSQNIEQSDINPSKYH